MWIVNLETNPNGSHNDHNADHITSVDEGWAKIPDDFSVPASFPFVDIEVDENNTVVAMTEKEVPQVAMPEPKPSIDARVSDLEAENALLKAQISAQSEQMDFYEDCIAEMAMVIYA